ncbi:MAG: cation transporter [Lachnospiraceae bacterium]|nr:cation transporter [Lachnospiraceae bacterium]
MTNFLVKRFIKDYEKTEDIEVRTAYGTLASVVGMVCNLLLFIAKILIGILTASISIMADAFNNLSDAASSVIGFAGVKLAARPADKEHPFGHGRYEYISALVVAFLIIQVGFSCFKNAFMKIIHPEGIRFSYLSVVILLLSVGMKIWLSIFNRRLGKKINSSVMKATAADALSDVFVTSATILSLIISHVSGIVIDGYMGIVVSVFVLMAGINIAKDTLEPLMGSAIDRELYERLTKKIESYQGIIGTHDLVVHNYGPSHTRATIHCEVPNDIALESAHEIIDQIERDILEEENILLVIHLDPVEVNNSRVGELKQNVLEIIQSLEPKASIHDFRMITCETQINLIFELVIPYGYTKQMERELLLQILQEVRNLDSRYQCVISVENSLVSE